MNIPMEPIRLAAQLTTQMLPKAFIDFATLAAIGAPILAVILEITAKARKKIFYDKLAGQIATLSLILYLLFMLCLSGAAVYFSRKIPWVQDWFINPSSPLMMLYITLGVTLLSLIPYKYSWKKLKKNKALHISIGTAGALGGVATIHVATIIMKSFFSLQTESIAPAVPQVPFYSYFYEIPGTAGLCLAALYLIMAISFAATAGGLYLALRRNKDNFGRDYYKFSLPVISKWALIPTLAQLAAVVAIFYYLCGPNIEILYGDLTTAICLGVSLGLTILCCAIWIVTCKSETPMRHKIGLGLAPFFIIAAHATLMAGAMKLYLTLP
ncbi:hypothetical protein [Maridesulfovibrio hydrothermalis]|uniref:Uncharacterized protein n=1 Tax=Maridesulfovibrio hydrothermalis AM13 = DSM 14728 TaxID=1121451 RepID=L0RBD6_9BACT|nr:hypothetical protein [Maridesulfovibrio hydrothermalis]CCO24069.1 conserved membrane protein of unknown function [Maridesulfovibrio hydrothermalis AM13 = DSM 14728]